MHLRELVGESADPGAELDSGTDRTQRVILVHLRDTEYRQDSVSDELLDGSAVALQMLRASMK